MSPYDTGVTGDLDLFGNPADGDHEDSPRVADSTPDLAARWQVDLLRKALDSRGFSEVDERRKAIEEVVGRPVDSLQTLSQVEALDALKRFGESAPVSRSGSAWDERDEDTWIDRL